MVYNYFGLVGLGEFSGPGDGVFGIADFVDEVVFEGVCGGVYSTVGECSQAGFGDVGTGLFDDCEEVLEEVVDYALEKLLLLFCHVVEWRGHVFHLAAFDCAGLYSDFVESSFEVDGLHDRADASGDAGGLGDDAVGSAGDVVSAACSDVED